MNILVIGEAVSAVLSAWKAGESVLENIINVIIAFASVGGVGGNPFAQAALRIATGAEAGAANLAAGQAATVASDTIDGKTYSLVIVANGSTAAAALGL